MQCSLVAALAIVLLTAGVNSANAGIIVLDETTFTTGFNKSSTHTFTNDALGGFDVTGYDKLVFVASSEGIDNLLSVTYGGVALTEAVTAASANRGSFIYYLDNPTVNGDLFVQGDSSGNGIGGTLFGLTGTQAGVGNTDTAGSGSSNATNVATFNASLGSIVIGSGTGNNNAAVVDAPQTAITFGLNVGSAFHSAGYQLVDPAGSVDASFSASRVVAAAEFLATPIPEPGSLAMLGVGGLMLLTIHRRR